ncbi:hypothetical protein ACPCSF_34530 [Streptomyces griseoincarnatus]
MGEKKSNLIAQQALEIVLVAAVAIGLSSMFAPGLTQSAAQALLGQEATAAQKALLVAPAPVLAPALTACISGSSPVTPCLPRLRCTRDAAAPGA